jgi:hypothetical protein
MTDVKVEKSAELQQLESLERDLYTRLRECEKRIATDEGQYFQLSILSSTAPTFGNLVSGWEGLLEGKQIPDKKRGVDRIFSGALCETTKKVILLLRAAHTF